MSFNLQARNPCTLPSWYVWYVLNLRYTSAVVEVNHFQNAITTFQPSAHRRPRLQQPATHPPRLLPMSSERDEGLAALFSDLENGERLKRVGARL